jgi:acyl carrier protein
MGMDTVELVMAVEAIFEIDIPDEQAEQLETVGKLHQFVVAELIRRGRAEINPAMVFDQLRTIICRQLGVKPVQVVPEAHFIHDLGAD